MKITYLIGVDEVGRGPLAGPVAVGVVCIPAHFDLKTISGIKDSKQLSERNREAVFKRIQASKNVRCVVSTVRATSIDAYGIQACIRKALRTALAKLDVDPRSVRVLLDGGLYAPEEYVEQKTIIRGDAREPIIGAASIVAKVTRDRYMERQHTRYPHYGFDRHKGYGTKDHCVAIATHGLCPLHRRSFCRRFL